ncbi:hypothetical protein [Marinifilum caeruleilacunae]|uniref:Uncharacterized protein n=1 Tax=Marinifilum caeruleilacunae TaxID=2499076 RepID=A0ABX1WR17_9BACT|nr:hypothetical protein [Marinifilum caeruleilacunae]NOU58384.1 hypothetical protein [Marinifilum caeruleilacunae]
MQQHIKHITLIGICLIGMLIVNNALFTHWHSMPDGQMVVHAHPFHNSTNPPAEHDHSENDLQILQNISVLFFIGALFVAFLLKNEARETNDTLNVSHYNVLCIRDFGRAPPQ